MRRRHNTGMSNVTAGLIALVLALVAVFLGFTKAIPFKSHFEVSARFQSANNLRPNSPVRIAGVLVGKVTKVEHDTPGETGALVTMRIQDNGRPLHKDAEMTIRPRIFLEGNFFVDVQPGSPSQPELEDGDVIPVNQTNTPVQLDQILTALQSDTREDLKTLLQEYSTGIKGKGARGFNRSIQYWEPAYRDSAIVADATLGQVERDLSEYIRQAATVADALDQSPSALKDLITDFNVTARAFASENVSLRSGIRELPRTLEAGLPALAALNDAFPAVRALARELRPGVRSTGPMIDEALPFVRQLQGLVSQSELRGLTADLRGTIPSLARLSSSSVPLYQEVRRASSCQNEVVLPWTRDKVGDTVFPAQGPVYQEAVKPFRGLAGESRSGDANGQWFRVLAAGGLNLVTLKPGVVSTTAFPLVGHQPSLPPTRPPLRPDVPCETQQKPNLDATPGAPPEQTRFDTSNPAYQKRYAKARDTAIKWLEDHLEEAGLDKTIKVGDVEVDLPLIKKVARLNGKKVESR